MTPPLDLAAIRARAAAATPGPWNDVDGEVRSVRGVAGFDSDGDPRFQPDLRADVVSERWAADAALIAHAPADLAALCDAVEAQAAALADRDATIAELRAALDRAHRSRDYLSGQWDAERERLSAVGQRHAAAMAERERLVTLLTERDATIAAQAAECERLRGAVGARDARIAEQRKELARLHAECEPLRVRVREQAERGVWWWEVAHDALRCGLEECERLRAALRLASLTDRDREVLHRFGRQSADEADALRWGATVAERDALRAEVADLRRELAHERDRCPECGTRRVGRWPAGDRCPDCVAGVSTASVVAERDALRAIVAGRETAPTEGEVEAHALDHPQRYAMAQGAWLVRTADGDLCVAHGQAWSSGTYLAHADTGRRIDDVQWARPLGSDGEAVAWPVVEGRSAEMAAILCPDCHGILPAAMPDTPEAATAACRCGRSNDR